MGNSSKKIVDLFLIAAITFVGGCSLNPNDRYKVEPASSTTTIVPAPTPGDKPDSEESIPPDYYSDDDDYYVEDDDYYYDNSSSSGAMIYGSPSKSKSSGNTGMSSGTRGGIGSSGSMSGG
jgi:hypothetical protein